uniref:Uncharacterized protein n=1 Tax=Anguilla anguilla TaxID=7936 RepID=A0A0E9TEQ7_ANGAN
MQPKCRVHCKGENDNLTC